jgi:hypothetical protein
MAEIVNLKSRRKQAARVVADQQAQQNRILHGRTKAERLRDEMQAAREARARANAKLER